MNLVFIYGPPGVGKLTVAKELAKLTRYKIFHNHMTVDLLTKFFTIGTDQFWNINTKLRLSLVEAAAKQNISLILTNVYAKGEESYVKSIIKTVKKHKGQAFLVKLSCHHSEHHKRIRDPSRKEHGKQHTVKALQKVMKQYNITSTVPIGKSLEIDNTHISAKKCAKLIKSHCHL